MNAHHDFPKTTVTQFVLALLGSLFAPLIAIILVVMYIVGIQATHIESKTPAPTGNNTAVAERIKPVAEVSMAAAGGGDVVAAVQKTGEQITQNTCAMCHGTGVGGSPKIGDKAAWEPRIAQGFDTLLKNAINGIRAMPPRGSNPALSDHDLALAIVYMANKSGASFKEPAAPAAPASK
ncbi:MAG: c-type cytochrome [Methylobacillus sp.]|jgi:cytochrome c5|nr:c-type cytochrome [Methylobacillus sp.]